MKKYILPTITILSLIIGVLLTSTIMNHVQAQQMQWGNLRIQISKFDQLLGYMQRSYVEELNIDSITDDAMQDIVEKLDPHSSYIPKKDLELVNSELGSSFSGIGVQFSIQQDTISIISVISNGPSEAVGILAGDKIVEVDDSTFVGKSINNEKVMHKLRGPKDTQVKLGIKRSGELETLHFTVTRGDIPVHSVDASFLIEDSIGYVRVNKFGDRTHQEFLDALTELKAQGAVSYIIDLRENSGGFMDQAIKMANEFLNYDDMIVYSEGRAYPRYEAKSNGLGRFKRNPIVVLIDQFSASASEIFAGAMQDNDRATIIGQRSFGKGLVQQQFPLSDGSAVRLTVARYYTPSGRCIQKPYTLGQTDDYRHDIEQRYENGEFFSQDSVHLNDTTKYYTKSGKIVYGGGGITPDIFIPRDTTLNTPWYNRAANRAYTYQFAYQYTDKNRKKLTTFKDYKQLESYLKKQNIVSDFVQFCTDKGIEPNEQEIKKSTPLAQRIIIAYITRNVLGDNQFFQLYQRDDPTTKEAILQLQKR